MQLALDLSGECQRPSPRTWEGAWRLAVLVTAPAGTVLHLSQACGCGAPMVQCRGCCAAWCLSGCLEADGAP